MEHKKSNHSWDEEEIKKYLEQSAEAEEIPPELETENMRKYIKTQTTGEQQKKHKNITGNIKHWYPAVTAACLCIILLAGVFMETSSAIIILSPVFLPLVKAMGISTVHFGILFVVGIAIGMITPPVAINLFVASGITGLPIERISKSVIPYLIGLIIVFFMIVYVPLLIPGLM